MLLMLLSLLLWKVFGVGVSAFPAVIVAVMTVPVTEWLVLDCILASLGPQPTTCTRSYWDQRLGEPQKRLRPSEVVARWCQLRQTCSCWVAR